MIDGFAEEFAVLPQRYAGHLTLSLSAILTGLVVSVPLGIIAARNARLAGPALGFASVVQTIPGLALLALMVPLLGGRIGFWPAFTALALYSVLPILRNAIVGLQEVPERVREAALGVGMTPRQRLMMVDLPLAAPIMVAGLRTATVWVVGAATLSTPVGAESLGNYIFAGLQIRDWSMVLFGCVVSAGLALALDQSIRLFEYAALKRSSLFAGLGTAALLAITIPAFLQPATQSGSVGQTQIVEQVTSLEGQSFSIGAKPFAEQYILAHVIRAKLEADGARVTIRENLGSTIGFDALATGEIDVFVDYSGTLWATVMKRDEPVGRHLMFAEVSSELLSEYGILTLGQLGFENAYAFAMTRERASELGISAINDLKGRSDLTKGGDIEFFARPEWVRVRDAYDLSALGTRGMDSTFMYQAVASGEVDVITAYTTDGRIDAFDLVLLDDPLGALPPYDAMLLVTPDAQEKPRLHQVLSELVMSIDPALMRAANARVDLDGESPEEAAGWLLNQLESRE